MCFLMGGSNYDPSNDDCVGSKEWGQDSSSDVALAVVDPYHKAYGSEDHGTRNLCTGPTVGLLNTSSFLVTGPRTSSLEAWVSCNPTAA